MAVLLLGVPHWLVAQPSVAPADLSSVQAFAAPAQLPAAYTSPADTDCALRIQTALLHSSDIQHQISAFEVDDPVTPQGRHRRGVVEAASVTLGHPSSTFTRLHLSRQVRESWRVFYHAGRAPPTA